MEGPVAPASRRSTHSAREHRRKMLLQLGRGDLPAVGCVEASQKRHCFLRSRAKPKSAARINSPIRFWFLAVALIGSQAHVPDLIRRGKLPRLRSGGPEPPNART